MAALRHLEKGVIVQGRTHWDLEMRKQVQAQDFDSRSIDWEFGYINAAGDFVSSEK